MVVLLTWSRRSLRRFVASSTALTGYLLKAVARQLTQARPLDRPYR